MKIILTQILIILATVLPIQSEMIDNPLLYTLNINNFEKQTNDTQNISWDTFAWIGYDVNKLYIYSTGDKPNNDTQSSENQLLFSHAIQPYWDIQIGVDYDKVNTSSKTWGVLALQGLAPYYFNTKAALLIGENGNVGLRIDLEYDALLTQRLILTPSFASDFYTQDTPNLALGSGLSNLTIGARLRYEIRREFAPYLGVEWTKNFANTYKYDSLNETYITIGLKAWF